MRKLSILVSLLLASWACTPDDSSGSDPDVDSAVLGDAAPLVDASPDEEVDAAVDAAPIEDALPPDMAPELEALSLNSLIPNRGPIEGGTQIRIIGTGFGEGLVIRIGENACAEQEIVTPNQVQCVVPAGIAGPTTVTATHPRPSGEQMASITDGFTYFEPVGITSVSPEQIPVRGGIELTIVGTGLLESSRVEIGGNRGRNVTVNEDGSLSVLAPAGEPGPADLSVSNFNGMATSPGAFFYYEDLEVDTIIPPVGPLAGGVDATISGRGLLRATRVSFGDAVAEVQGAGDNRESLALVVPRGNAAGPVDVSLINENGEVTLESAFIYYDDAADGFTVAGIAPNNGPVEGGNAVFIAGAGFTDTTVVSFDGRAIPCELLDANRLQCTPPPGVEGSVDVEISEGGETVSLPGAYTYFQNLELIAVIPDRGAVAGGGLVTLSGIGFTPTMDVLFGEEPLVDVEFVDDTTIRGLTPPNTPGPVTVKVATPFARSTIPAGFTYYDPGADLGGTGGARIDGSVNVTVISGGSGQPEPEVAVLAVSADQAVDLGGITNDAGQITLSAPGLVGPISITAAKEGFEATTIEDVDVEDVTIILFPNDGEGEPPPPVPGVIARGIVSGLDVLPKPLNETYVNIIVVESSHTSPRNRGRLPPPGPGALLMEDGPFEAFVRPGEIALIATAGEIDRNVLKAFQDGEMDYWTMRNSLSVTAMGLRRYISANPGDEIDGLDIEIDHPMDLVFPVDLDNPPAGGGVGPQFYVSLPSLNLGAEGYWMLDTQAYGVDPNLTMRKMPRLEGWDPDIQYFLFSVAFSNSPDNTPMSLNVEETRDVEAGVLITPFVGSPFILSPNEGGPLNQNQLVTWGVHDGFEGPIAPPSANLVLIAEPALGPPKPLWRYVTPSLVTELEIPPLPEIAGATGLGGGMMFLTVNPFIIEGGAFDFDNFTYDDLAQYRWKSWGIRTITFTR